MADRNATNSKAIWMKQAEEAKLKSEAEKSAAAKAAFEATFKDLSSGNGNNKARHKQQLLTATAAAASDSDSEQDSEDEDEDLSNKPIGPVDPSKCTAAGAGIAGGTAGAASSFMVVTKDSDGRKVPDGGAEIRVQVAPGVGVGGTEQEGIVKDMNDGTYSVTYVVPKRGNYMLTIECNGKPIMGSPFPVFFSAGTSTGGVLGMPPTSSSNFPNLINQTMPNMPNYSASVSGSFPGLLGMIPGVVSGASGGAILPGIGASLGEVCREYLNGRCLKTDCKLNHPPHNLLMTALAATTTMGTLSQVPMAPSAAAMAAAQAIVAAQALQAHAAQVQAQQSAKGLSGSPDKAGKADALKRTLQVSNLSPLLTVEQLKQLFSFCGTVVECNITDSKHFAYIEYSKAEEATAALALNNMDVGGRPMNVEMAKSLPQKSALLNSSLSSSSLPMMMQQAVAMQQMQFQQSLLMQQTLNAQQAANRAASMKSATELAAARAAEISKKLSADGLGEEEKPTKEKSRSPSVPLARSRSKSRSPVPHRRASRARSRTKSRSPVSYHRRRRSRSYSPPRRLRDRRSRSPLRSRYLSSYDNERRSSRNIRDSGDRYRRRDLDRSRDRHSPLSRRKKSRSVSPTRKSYRSGSDSPKNIRESSPNRAKKSSRTHSRSPRSHRGRRTSPKNDDVKLKHRKRSRSKSVEELSDKMDAQDGNEKHRDRSRSRSVSVEGKYSGRGRSPQGSSDDNRSKDRRHSRPKSAVGKHNTKEKVDNTRDEKLKYSHKRRSRSNSLERSHQTQEKGDENKDRKLKHRYRRRSRSRSVEVKHSRRSRSPRGVDESKKKHKRRSRSKSVEGKHRSDHRIDQGRDEKSKHRSRQQSISAEGKCHRSKLSPASLKGGESKCTRHSRSQSSEDRDNFNDGRDETRDDKSVHSGEKIEDTVEEPDSNVKDFMIIEDNGLSISRHRSYNEKKSVKNISLEHYHEELRKEEMPDTQHREQFRNGNANNMKKGSEDQDDCKRTTMAEERLERTDSLSPQG